MDRWSVPANVRTLAWLNATHDFKAALYCYRTIWLLDQDCAKSNLLPRGES
jgi:hypothetical protein